MNQKALLPREISPDEWLTPPVNYGLNPPKHVLDANAQAANMMNKAKDRFICRCLGLIVPIEKIGEAELESIGQPEEVFTAALFAAIDTTQLKLILKPTYTPVLLKPEEAHLSKKDQISARKTSDALEMHYKGIHLGTLTITYETGQIEISAQVLEPQQ